MLFTAERVAATMPPATNAAPVAPTTAFCTAVPAVKLGLPAIRPAATPGAFQVRNAIAPTVSKALHISVSVRFPEKVSVLSTGSITAMIKASTMSLIPEAMTAPMAFSAKNFVCSRNPNGRKIPTRAVIR